MYKYDLIIIGGGPSALGLAHYYSNDYRKILIIEKECSIGGCHRVKRVSQNNELLMTEHGPRIYSTSFINFIEVLNEIGYKFTDLFTPYKVQILSTGISIITRLQFKELYQLTVDFFKFTYDNRHGLNISIYEYTKKYNFSHDSILLLDKLCRLSDGADMYKYPLNKFLQLINQQGLYKIYQPKKPNDEGLFTLWGSYLENRNVDFLLNTKINKLQINSLHNNIEYCITDKNEKYYAKKYILAMPPVKILDLIIDSRIENAFGDYRLFKKWCFDTNYITYVSIIFHWDHKIVLTDPKGMPFSDWGIIYNVLSDYIDYNETSSKTVISTAITIVDKKSTNNNKTANQCNSEEIIKEVLLQLEKELNMKLPITTASIVNPNNYKDDIWHDKDTAFFDTVRTKPIKFKSDTIHNLYNLGTQNGKSKYYFTTIESAISNAKALANVLNGNNEAIIKPIFEVQDLLLYILIIILWIIIYICLLQLNIDI